MDKENWKVTIMWGGFVWAVTAIGALVSEGASGFFEVAVGAPLVILAFLLVAKVVSRIVKGTGSYKPLSDYSDTIGEVQAQHKKEYEDLVKRSDN